MRELKLQLISTSTLNTKVVGYEWISLEHGRWMHQYEGQPVSEGIALGIYLRRQFTGLYDKNGKEIYDGDIIQLGKKPKEVQGYVPISWIEGRGTIAWRRSTYWIDFENLSNELGSQERLDMYEAEVVGMNCDNQSI